MTHSLQNLIAALAETFAAEDCPGGDEAAEALLSCLATADGYDVPGHDPIPGLAEATLSHAPGPLADTVRAALPHIHWRFSGLEDGRIRPEIARSMMTCEIIGPTGMIFHATVRVGLFAQSAGLDYVNRCHAAEETFVMIGGEGDWSTGDGPAETRVAPAVIHHPSNVPHRSVTRGHPLLAAWRWTGDIGFEKYKLLG